ncbi:transcription factor ILR3-like [Lotus japonicus]|uniref:transcription factor ILR3-like n=1 Tax=Lotus japonicus TaxID=34305 RepID=UPI0001E24448|nr:transcription factor ILR3-like [Lotus japonicus]
MEIDSSGDSCWLYDYGFDDISVAAAADFMVADSADFTWVPSNMNLEMEYSLDSTVFESGPSKRLRTESSVSGSKACREKLRRDKLNERFLELSSILEPGRQPKTDKAAIISDAVRVVTQLRNEAEKLKEMNNDLQEKIKELKAEKNEIRDEKNKLKLDKEKLEKKVKLRNVQPGFLPHADAAVKGKGAASHKLIPYIGYPGIAMWQFMPSAVLDTSRDHLLRPPVA